MSRGSALTSSAGYHGSQSSDGMPASCPTERFFADPVAPQGSTGARILSLRPRTVSGVISFVQMLSWAISCTCLASHRLVKGQGNAKAWLF